jgi:dTDP-N-acetylfucosamine:lipid II N-acetylfucosaminyltransferase
MRILHIFSGVDGYIVGKDYTRFIQENFGRDDHSIAVIGKPEVATNISFPRDRPEIKYFNSYLGQFIEVYRYFSKFDKLIFHSLFIGPAVMASFLVTPSLMNKLVWVEWGADLYTWKTPGSSVKSWIFNTINYSFRRRIKHFVAIFPPDMEIYKKEFKSNARTFYASYVNGLYDPIYVKDLNLKTLSEKVRTGDCINIQIGHSCDPNLNHIEVLENLLKFKDENIKIFIPLSYGNMENGDQVERKARDLFGDKVACLREMMDRDQYMSFLSTIDVAIFNTQRQIGLGNLAPLRYMEKKIFLPAGSVMYQYFRSQGIDVCDYNEIKIMDFNRFTQPVDMKKAKDLMKSGVTNISLKVEMWSKVFNTPLKQDSN